MIASRNPFGKLTALVVSVLLLGLWAGPAGSQTAKKLNCKGCVKSKQVKNGGIKGADLKDNTIDGSKIQDNAIGGSKIQNDAIDAGKIADDAVTSAKILDGTITGADIAAGVIPTVLGLKRTLSVSPVGDGSDASANGMELLDAIAFVGGVAPPPSATNPWLIKVEPGVYDVGSTFVVMIPFVDIEGSGQGVTRIIGDAESFISPGVLTGLVIGAANAELRFLTVENDGTGNTAAVAVVSETSLRIDHVTAIASGAPAANNAAVNVRENATAVITNSIMDGENFDFGTKANAVANIVSTEFTNGTISQSVSSNINCVGTYSASGGAFTELDCDFPP